LCGDNRRDAGGDDWRSCCGDREALAERNILVDIPVCGSHSLGQDVVQLLAEVAGTRVRGDEGGRDKGHDAAQNDGGEAAKSGCEDGGAVRELPQDFNGETAW
jgi:hypothetical protein